MPVDRNTAASLASELGETYAQLERDLIEQVGHRLAQGIDAPDWQAKKLVAIGDMRRYAERAVERVTGPAQEQVARSLVQAYAAGGTEALRELTKVQSTHADWIRLANIRPGPRLTEMIDKRVGSLAEIARRIETDLPGAASLNRLINTTVTKLGGAHTPILRTLDDVYRQTIARTAVPSVLAGSETRRQAAQRAFTAFTRQGITGFVDGAGRGWSLAGYVEMAGRTATAQAAVEGHMDRLADAGVDLVIVSNAAMECEKCRPWEGKVLARGGQDGKRTIKRESEVDDDVVSVDVAGSVDEAVGAGLLHPNCRHSLSAYLPGLTVAPTHTADPDGARARDRLRALERRKRDLLRQEAATKPFLDGKTPPALKDRIKAVNADIKQHVAANADLKRKPERERIDLGLTGAKQAELKTARDVISHVPASIEEGAGRKPAALSGAEWRAGREAIDSYRGTGFIGINTKLRNPERFIHDPADAARVQGKIDAIDNVMRVSRVQQPITMYRGVDNLSRTAGKSGDLAGHAWTETAYSSTSAEERVARQFAEPGESAGAVLELRVPRGTGAVQLSGTDDHAELLLQRGLRITIVEDQGIANGKRRLVGVVEIAP